MGRKNLHLSVSFAQNCLIHQTKQTHANIITLNNIKNK